jgi:hypothetical protein
MMLARAHARADLSRDELEAAPRRGPCQDRDQARERLNAASAPPPPRKGRDGSGAAS